VRRDCQSEAALGAEGGGVGAGEEQHGAYGSWNTCTERNACAQDEVEGSESHASEQFAEWVMAG
jgi:hypothetical protein